MVAPASRAAAQRTNAP